MVASLLILVPLVSACGGGPPGPATIAQEFVAAWNQSDWTSMATYIEDPAPNLAASGAALTAGLDATRATHVLGRLVQKGSAASVPVTTTFQLPAVGAWRANTTLALVKLKGHWLVQWSPAVVQSALQAGEHLAFSRVWAARAPILGAGGTPLTVQGAQVVVGIEGSRVKSQAQVTSLLEAAGATSSQVATAFAGAAQNPDYFEPVFTLTQVQFNALGGQSSQLYQVAGTAFQNTSARQAATPGLAAHVVGTVGPITAQELQQLGPDYDATDTVGQTGLEQADQTQLAGTPGGTVTIDSSSGAVKATVATFAPKAGTPVQTSINLTVQQAAEAAMAGVTHYGALVAVNASTGQVLAAVSVPQTDAFDYALEGEFAPGSTFKVITSTALIEKGLTPSSPASCPQSIVVDGETFHNAEGDQPVGTMAQAFTESCNTAFIGLATANLSLATLPVTAAQYGIGSSPSLGLDSFGGSVPTPQDQAALAATAIGQASVVVSPVMMAMVAAALDTGTVRAPRLVSGTAGGTAATHTVPAAVVSDLQQMMLQVVQSGTAAGTGLPAGTHAKTGTAEYSQNNLQLTDAWLMGYDGNVAFAAVEQGGTGNGGPTCGPLVAKFLDALGSSA